MIQFKPLHVKLQQVCEYIFLFITVKVLYNINLLNIQIIYKIIKKYIYKFLLFTRYYNI